MPGDTTVVRVGERSIPIRTTGHNKERFTVILTALADGRKLKHFVVFKGCMPDSRANTVSWCCSMHEQKWLDE